GTLRPARVVDRSARHRRVFARGYDGHMALANSAALKLAGVTAETKEPAGGVIYRLERGKTPSGTLKDNAMGLVERLIPAPGEDEITEAVHAAMKACAANGLTSVQDMDGSGADTRRTLFRVLQRLARDGKMTLRLDLRWPIAMRQEVTNLGAEANFGNDYVRA